jgi:hypothetical protein
MEQGKIHSQNIISCIWDFDKTLIPGYMQSPIFTEYGIDEDLFWKETNMLPEYYSTIGQTISKDTCYLNHLLSYIYNGPLKGLNNKILRELGKKLKFYYGLPEFFNVVKNNIESNQDYKKANIIVEHYIISTGLGEMIRGSIIADYVESIFACELVEAVPPPYFTKQVELNLDHDPEISQIGLIVDNTIKTRFLFEINKGTNKIPDIDVNAYIPEGERRIPFENMLYIADGPSDIPAFSVVKQWGGKTFAVYNPDSSKEFEQNDNLLQSNRIHGYGPADYRPSSSTYKWILLHVLKTADSIVEKQKSTLKNKIRQAPKHLNNISSRSKNDVNKLFQDELII